MAKASLIGGIGAWVLALGFSLAASAWPEYIKPHPYCVIALVIGGALMLLAPVVQWIHPIFAEKAAVELSITCDTVGLPMRYEGDLWILDTIFFHGLGKLSGPKNLEHLWPEEGVKGIGYRCTVKNYGTQPAFRVSLSLVVKTFDWVQIGPASWGEGDQKREQAATILIPEPLGQHGTDGFSFYICSHDPESSLSVRIPSVAWINSDEAKKKQQVAVRIASPINPLSVPPKLAK
jgi:hypothetical protein